MKAIIKTGGKQYLVEEGSVIFVEKLNAEEGKTVVFDEVLMLDGNVDKDSLKGAKVSGKVLKHGKNKKITRKAQGHRQPYTKVEIKKIG